MIVSRPRVTAAPAVWRGALALIALLGLAACAPGDSFYDPSPYDYAPSGYDQPVYTDGYGTGGYYRRPYDDRDRRRYENDRRDDNSRRRDRPEPRDAGRSAPPAPPPRVAAPPAPSRPVPPPGPQGRAQPSAHCLEKHGPDVCG